MPLEQGQIEEAAAFLFHLHTQRESAAALPREIAPLHIDDSYAIQDALHDTAGWPIGVLKVGCTSEAARQALGIAHPIAGRIRADAVFASATSIARSFFGHPPSIECEIAVRIGPDATIDAVAPALELVDPRIRSSGAFGGLATIADNSAGAAVVLGPALDAADAGPLDELSVTLHCDDELVAGGTTASVLGGPEASLVWITNHESARGRTLTPGAWVITGTCTGLTPSVWGHSYSASFGPLGEVSFSLGE